MNSAGINRAVFLDRDGVINNQIIKDGKPFVPFSSKEIHIMPGVREGLAALKGAGYLLIVVTNQPDVSRKNVTREMVEEIHNYLMLELPLDDIKVCFHDNEDHCDCRKPKPGNILNAADEYQIDLGKSYMVGDRWSDIEAARSAGCGAAIYMKNNYMEKLPQAPDLLAGSFSEAVEFILKSGQQES